MADTILKFEVVPSKVQVALEKIREAILTGQYDPGDRLSEAALAYKFRLSRNPVRSALIQLQAMGLVVNNMPGGVRVTKLTTTEMQYINSVRVVLEAEALWLAREKMTPDIAARLEEIIVRMGKASGFLHETAMLDIEFHRLIWQTSGNFYLARLLEPMVAQLFAQKTLENRAFDKAAMGERRKFRDWRVARHRDLLDLLLRRVDVDPREAILAHIRHAFDDPERYCRQGAREGDGGAPHRRRAP